MEIIDELEELVFLENPRILVTEWIPCGRNQILSLTDGLEAVKEVNDSLYTTTMDVPNRLHTLVTGPVLTKLQMQDHDPASYIRFHAKVFYPETVHQVEEFGVHVDWTGRIIYGLILEQVEKRKKRQSLDHMSRVVADIVLDTSTMIETMLSVFQRDVLDTVFFENPNERNKFVTIIAERMTPKRKSPADYLTERRLKGEINQVIENVHKAESLSDGEAVFLGTKGIILVSPEPTRYEEVLSLFNGLQALDIFQRNIHARVGALWDEMRETRRLTEDVSELDIQRVSEAQHSLSQMTDQLLAIGECLRYMEDALEALSSEWRELRERRAAEIVHPGVSRLLSLLDIGNTLDLTGHRTRGIGRTLVGLQKEVSGVKELASTIGERQMRHLNENLQENIVQMETMSRSSQRTSVAINMLQLILAGSLAFDILKTLSGDYENTVFSSVASENPVAWLGLTVLVWVGLASIFFNIIRPIEKRRERGLHARVKLNAPYDNDALKSFLSTREMLVQESTWDLHHHVFRRSWSERGEGWRNNEVTIQIDYDELTGLFRDLVVSIPAPQYIDENDAIQIALLDLVTADVLEHRTLDAFRELSGHE